MSAQTTSHDELVRRLQIELEQLRKMTDALTEFRGVVFTINTSRGFKRGTVSECLGFVNELFAQAMREAAAGAVSGGQGAEYYVPVHIYDVRATRV